MSVAALSRRVSQNASQGGQPRELRRSAGTAGEGVVIPILGPVFSFGRVRRSSRSRSNRQLSDGPGTADARADAGTVVRLCSTIVL